MAKVSNFSALTASTNGDWMIESWLLFQSLCKGLRLPLTH